MAMLNNQRVFHEAKVWTFTWQEVRRWKTRQFRQHEIYIDLPSIGISAAISRVSSNFLMDICLISFGDETPYFES